MHVLIAPDKFKGSLTSAEAADAIAQAVHEVFPSATTETVVVADGGEGMLDVALSAGAELRTSTVLGPLGDPVAAEWGMLGSTAVIELARASGLQLISPTPASALRADTYGVGQLILAALDAGVTEIIIGVGGAASTDGGSGALRALGARIVDDNNHDVTQGGEGLLHTATVDVADLDPRLGSTRIRLATDVRNTLLGAEGAAAVYGPQKGAGVEEVRRLDAALSLWAMGLSVATGRDVVASAPGSGAAGGFPAAFLATTNASIESGFDVAATLAGLPQRIKSADLLFVGEGSLDSQTLEGKAPAAAAALAAHHGVEVLAVAGRIALTDDQLRAVGITHAVAMNTLAPSQAESMRDGRKYLVEAAALALKSWQHTAAART